MKTTLYQALAIATGLSAVAFNDAAAELPGSQKLSQKQHLGRQLFFDTNLSEPAGQACSTCHDPSMAFTDMDKTSPTSKGAVSGLHGNRNTPTAMYSAFAPVFHFDQNDGLYIGGQFLDGRASTLADQAKGPFINPVEMANPTAETVVNKVRNASYAPIFNTVYGADALSDPQLAYNRIADAIAAFEESPVLNRFTSKYDFYLRDKATLTKQEKRGLKIFEAANKGNCAACHPNRPVDGVPPLFTDHSYDNLGIPKNPDNLFYQMSSPFNPDGAYFVDLGLGASLNMPDEDGKFKVPTLRNVAVTAPYMHNGYFKTLRSTVEFYSNRDIKQQCPNDLTSEANALKQSCWPTPEVQNNVNHTELGALNLKAQDIDDLVAFLKTLTDGYKPHSPWKVKVFNKL